MSTEATPKKGWIAVDLDGTIAYYDGWKGDRHIGAPISPMVDRVRAWLADGRQVKIFTARVSHEDPAANEETRKFIQAWCSEHIGQSLDVTCVKDFQMIELYDDRAVTVEANTGRLLTLSRRGLG